MTEFGTLLSLNQGASYKKIKNNKWAYENNKRDSNKLHINKLTKNTEGFQDFNLTKESKNIINNNNYSNLQQSTTDNDALKQIYNSTLIEYQTLLSKFSGLTNNFIDRVNTNNPYLGKNIQFTNNILAYVTNKGVVKLYPNQTDFNAIVGINGCPKEVVNVPISWKKDYNILGETIPLTPPLITGSPMTIGQSCGFEGENIFINELVPPNIKPKYIGCYADIATGTNFNRTMSFIGATPLNIDTIQNGNFSQPQLSKDSTNFYGPNSTNVPNWVFNAFLINESTVWGFPIPYPVGNQAVNLQMTYSIYQTIKLFSSINYKLNFLSCARSCCDNSGESNPIKIELYTTNNDFVSEIFTLNSTINKWTNSSISFQVLETKNYNIKFRGTSTTDRSTAIQGIELTTSDDTFGSYSYEDCKTSAINAGYRYFALQNVNTNTSKGYCAVSNSQPAIVFNGESKIPNKYIPLWSSNTSGQSGNIALLNTSGSLVVTDINGKVSFSTPYSITDPNNYYGCYTDNEDRAIPLYNGGSQSYNLQTCQQLAKNNNSNYFTIQNSNDGQNAQCGFSNDFAHATKYGPAKNCTKITDGSWSGGGWSNAIYNTNTPDSNYYLILQDDGNMCIYRGMSPTDNQGLVWTSNTSSQQQQPNTKMTSNNSKYGTNWMSTGSSLSAGDFISSTDGSIVLIMQSDGNLILYTFGLTDNCQKMNDGNIGGGVNANATYDIGTIGYPNNINKLSYIDQDSILHNYPSNNVSYTNIYTEFLGFDSDATNIQGETFTGGSLNDCKKTCNSLANCSGFVFDTNTNTCYPKSGDNLVITKKINPNTNLYIRNKNPLNTPIGVSEKTLNTNTIQYENYIKGEEIGSQYGLANIGTVEKQQLEQLKDKLNLLSNQINNSTNNFDKGTFLAENQITKNITGLQNYVSDIKKTNENIQNFNPNIKNILNDSDLIVLQKNYEYYFWSILAGGCVLLTMSLVKRN